MQEKLLIYLHAEDLSHPSWAVVADNTIRQTAAHDESEGLSTIAHHKEVIVIAPAEDVLLTCASLPKMNRSRLLQALPFALEDHLIAEVDSLHFAIEKQQQDGTWPVAIVAHEKMQQWLTLLKEWQIEPDMMVSAVQLLPVDNANWRVLIAETAMVNTGPYRGFGCDKHNLQDMLQMISATDAPLPTLISIDNATKEAVASNFALQAPLQEAFISGSTVFSIFVAGLKQSHFINLLQGKYALKKTKLPRRALIRKAAIYLAVFWISLLFIYPTVSYFILKQRVLVLNQGIEEIYHRHFPQASSVVAPKLRLEEKLKQLNAQKGENHLLTLLSSIGKGMEEVSSVKLKSFDFQNNQLTLELTASSSEDFSTFSNFLQKQGLNVKQQNANLVGSNMTAALIIE